MDYRIRKDRNRPHRYHIDLRIKLCHRSKITYHHNTRPEQLPRFVNEIFDTCDGIVSVTVSPHTLTVSHHSMFHWDSDLKKYVVEILRINFATTDRSVCDMSEGGYRCSPSLGKIHQTPARLPNNQPELLRPPRANKKKVD